MKTMQWFKTPEEYMADYQPERILPEAIIAEGKRCPRCGNTNPLKLTSVKIEGCYRPGDEWRCKRWSCGHKWPMTFTQKVERLTPEQWVFGSIRARYRGAQAIMSMGGTPAGFTQVKGPSIIGSLGMIEAFSGNPETAKTGILVKGMDMYRQHQQQQAANLDLLAFESEAEYAWRLAEEYFRIPERRAAEAKAAEDNRMREMARIMAQEMVAEVRRSRS